MLLAGDLDRIEQWARIRFVSSSPDSHSGSTDGKRLGERWPSTWPLTGTTRSGGTAATLARERAKTVSTSLRRFVGRAGAHNFFVPLVLPTWTGMIIYAVINDAALGVYFGIALMALVLPHPENAGRGLGLLATPPPPTLPSARWSPRSC
jgi:hypothetical protein